MPQRSDAKETTWVTTLEPLSLSPSSSWSQTRRPSHKSHHLHVWQKPVKSNSQSHVTLKQTKTTFTWGPECSFQYYTKYMFARVCIWTRMYMRLSKIQTHTQACVYIRMYIICTDMMWEGVYTYMYMYAQKYIYICTHTSYIHMCLRKPIKSRPRPWVADTLGRFYISRPQPWQSCCSGTLNLAILLEGLL